MNKSEMNQMESELREKLMKERWQKTAEQELKYAIKIPIEDGGWLYVTETKEDGSRDIATYDTLEEATKINFTVWACKGLVVECHKDPFGNPMDRLTDEEIEELRIKKHAIKEELYDKVKMEMFKASSKLEGIDYDKVNRVEVIDDTGRGYIKYIKGDEKVRYELQDDNRTLKIFIDTLKSTHELDHIEYEGIEVQCKTHPDAPHGFDRNSSLSLGRYVCECEHWFPDWEQEELEVKGWNIEKPAELKQLLEEMIERMNRI